MCMWCDSKTFSFYHFCFLLVLFNLIVFGCSVDEKARFVLDLGRFIVIAEYIICDSNLVAFVSVLVFLFSEYMCVYVHQK